MRQPRCTYKRTGLAIMAMLTFVMSFSKVNKVMGNQQNLETVYSSLQTQEKRFVNYDQDFVGFTISGQTVDTEYEVASSLEAMASSASGEVHAARTLVYVYYSLSCVEDRSRIKPLVQEELSMYSHLLSLGVNKTNIDIATTKRPGVAAEAINMRDDLRRTKDTLDSIILP